MDCMPLSRSGDSRSAMVGEGRTFLHWKQEFAPLATVRLQLEQASWGMKPLRQLVQLLKPSGTG